MPDGASQVRGEPFRPGRTSHTSYQFTMRVKRQGFPVGCDGSFFMQWRPPEAYCDCRLVVFPLNHELGAALVEAKDLVGEIEAVHDEVPAAGQTDAALSVNLQVRVEVAVTERSCRSVAVKSDVCRRAKSHPQVFISLDYSCATVLGRR